MFLQTKPLAGIAAFALFAVASPASAATLLQYDFANNSGVTATETPSLVAANLTGNAFARGTGLTAVSAGGAFNSSGWGIYTSNPNDYLTFGFSVADGYTASVNQVVFGQQRSNTGPTSMSLLASVDGGAFTNLGNFTVNTNFNSNTFDFAALTGTESVVFRIVSNITAGGTFRVQNPASGPVSINGDVAQIPTGVVPEPATWAMMIGGIGLAGGALRRRRSVSVRFA